MSSLFGYCLPDFKILTNFKMELQQTKTCNPFCEFTFVFRITGLRTNLAFFLSNSKKWQKIWRKFRAQPIKKAMSQKQTIIFKATTKYILVIDESLPVCPFKYYKFRSMPCYVAPQKSNIQNVFMSSISNI